MTEEYKKILKRVSRNADGNVMESLVKRGVSYKFSYGIKTFFLKEIAGDFMPSGEIANELWESNIREMRILATHLQPVNELSAEKMNAWVNDFNNPEIVEQACLNLFKDSEIAGRIYAEWCESKQTYIKMSGFVLFSLIAERNSKKLSDLHHIFELAYTNADSESLYVRNAIVRALVAVGKINKNLNEKAIETVLRISEKDSPSAKAGADDALFQLNFFGESLK